MGDEPIGLLVAAARVWVMSGRVPPPPLSRPDLWARLGLEPPRKGGGLLD